MASVSPLTALHLGQCRVDPPVVLAPMAGITNAAFRRLCREQAAGATGAAGPAASAADPAAASAGSAPGAAGSAPAAPGAAARPAAPGLYVCEMVTSRALVERNPKTLRMLAFEPGAGPRSVQLYGVDPRVVGDAVRMIVIEDLADHVDLNFGCSVPKVTRKGGGAALPWRYRLFEQILRAAVCAADGRPVTVKMRMGIDDDHPTYLDAGRIAQDVGVAWITLHGRTAAQRYSGRADWGAIAALKQVLEIPVLGNGDIWEADDALRMVRETGCDGVVVGRGCLGRPWLFADLVAAFAGRPQRVRPRLGEVVASMRRHAVLLADHLGSERDGCTDFRKHVAWYLKGYSVGSDLRHRLAMISSLAELDDLLGGLDAVAPFPDSLLGQPRGRTNSPGRVHLPEGWLADHDSLAIPVAAEYTAPGG
jgi:nifR3 family TIM-barrel protein